MARLRRVLPIFVILGLSLCFINLWLSVDTISEKHNAFEYPQHPPDTCSRLRSLVSSSILSTPEVWKALDLFETSYRSQSDPVPAFREWLLELWQWHTPERMERATAGHRLSITTNHTLQIVVLGGSVVKGYGCKVNTLDQKQPSDLACAWPDKYHQLLAKVLPVHVWNLGQGGSASDVGALMLRYKLLPVQPDLVLVAYAPNDASLAPDVARNYSHRVVRAALQQCYRTVLVDDMYGGAQFENAERALQQSGILAETASWFDVPLWKPSDMLRHAYFADLDQEVVRMASSPWRIHMGLGYHFSMAWAMTYATLDGIVRDCNLRLSSSSDDAGDTSDQHSGIIPSPRTPYRDFATQWKQRNGTCEASRCDYVWMVHPGTPRAEDVQRELDHYIASNDGWLATGKPAQQPRTGFYAQQANASFSMDFPPLKHAKFLTLVTLQSDLEEFRATLEVGLWHGDERVWSRTVNAHHEQRTSVHTTNEWKLPDTTRGFRLTFTLVEGSKFKIAGMALCANQVDLE